MACYVSWLSYYPHSEALRLWTVLQEHRPLGTNILGGAPLSAMCKSTLFCTHPSLNSRCTGTTDPGASALHASKPEMASPVGTTLASSYPTVWWEQVTHRVSLEPPVGPQSRLLRFSTGTWSPLYVFNKMTLRRAQCTSTKIKQRFSTSGIHFHKKVAVSSTQRTSVCTV